MDNKIFGFREETLKSIAQYVAEHKEEKVTRMLEALSLAANGQNVLDEVVTDEEKKQDIQAGVAAMFVLITEFASLTGDLHITVDGEEI